MKKSIAKNYIYNLLYQMLVLVLPLITTPYIARILGAENIGIYSYTLTISSYFILFGSLGIALYGQREIAYNQKYKKEYSVTFWEIVILRFITISISLLIFLYTFANGEQYQKYYRILMIEIFANALDISWFYQGLEEFKKTVLRNMLIKLISIVCIFTFVKTQFDLTVYYVIYVLSIIIGNASLWFYLPKYIEKVKISELNIIKHISPTISLFVPQIAIQVYTLLDKTMIGTIILDKSEVGYYDQSQKIIKVLLTIITSLGTVMMPRIANTFANGEKQKVKKYMKKSFNMVALIAFPMMFGIISVSKNFVPVFFGEAYGKVAILMCVISPIILLIGLSNITGTQYLLPTKRQKEYTISVICGAIINFTFNLILIRNYGAIGASIGTVMAELSVTIIQLYFVRKELKILDSLKGMKNYFISSIIMLIVCLTARHFIYKNVLSAIIQVILGIIIYISCLLLLKDQFLFEMINRLKKKLNRSK